MKVISLLGFKTYYIATVITAELTEIQTHRLMKQNREFRNIHTNSPEDFQRGAKAIQWRNIDFSTNGAGAMGHPQTKTSHSNNKRTTTTKNP